MINIASLHSGGAPADRQRSGGRCGRLSPQTRPQTSSVILCSAERIGSGHESQEAGVQISKPEEAHRCFVEAFNAADVEGLLALYEPEAKIVPQPGQVIGGRGAIRSVLEPLLAL